MDEGPEVPMETDVSSTTEDVPETQEVTGSHGNVETTIVVEKVEVDIDLCSQTDIETTQVNENACNISEFNQQSPQKEIQPQITSERLLTNVCMLISPEKPESTVAEVDKISVHTEAQSSTEIHQTGEPDSSSKEPHLSEDKICKDFKVKTPKLVRQSFIAAQQEELDNAELVQSSAVKKLQTGDSTKGIQQTPVKIQAPESTQAKAAQIPPEKVQEPETTQSNVTQNSPVKVQASKLAEGKLVPIPLMNYSPIKMQAPVSTETKPVQNSPTKIEKQVSKNASVQNTPVKNIVSVDSTKRKPIQISPMKIVKVLDSRKVHLVQKSPAKKVQELDSTETKTDQSTPIKTVQSLESSKGKIVQDSPENLTGSAKIKPCNNSPAKNNQSQDSDKTISIVKSVVKDAQTPETAEGKPKQNITQEKESQDSLKANGPIQDVAMPDKPIVNGKVTNKESKLDDLANKSQTTDINVDVTVEKETSNDSQIDSNADVSEKEHNKSISRELKSLIKSAKESKIISECTQLTSKMRKSRTAMDASNTSLNSSVEAEKIQGRRNSNNSQKSTSSDKSEKIALKRSMRSQNPEFVSKVKQFLNSVTGKGQKDTDEEYSEGEETVSKEKSKKDDSLSAPSPKIKKTEPPPIETKNGKGRLQSDPYCWRCHWTAEQAPNEKCPPMSCTVCPRTFHFKCLSTTERSKLSAEKSWVCPECLLVLQAESSDSRSHAMKKISLGMLCDLLKYALERIMVLNGVEPFMQPVDRTVFPDYEKYVVHPMDLTQMKENIAAGLYGSTEAFLSDTQWILHNSIIFNTLQSKLTAVARAILRSCRAEMGEIEACPECYGAAHAHRPSWFTDVCTTPHILLWAKLKGFPYWPAKGMSVSSTGHVDVRFFGAHDRAWVPAKDCFLYSEKDPNNFRTKRQDLLDSMQEAEQHIRNISRKYGKFVYPPFKTQLDTAKLGEQLKMMIPSFEGEVRTPIKEKSTIASPAAAKDKRSSASKSSKGSVHEGETSENEDPPPPKSRKMADGAEIARDDEMTPEKESSTMEVDTPKSKGKESSRKRRRSELEEAVITIIEGTNSSADKKKRVEDNKTDDKKTESQVATRSKENEEKEKNTDHLKDIEMTDVLKKKSGDTPKSKDNESSSNTAEKENRKSTPRVTPIRIAFVPKDRKTPKSNLSKETTAKIITPSKDTTKVTSSTKDNAKIVTPSDTPSSKTETPNKDNGKTATPSKEGSKTPVVNKDSAKNSAPNKEEKDTPQKQKATKTDKSNNDKTTKEDKTKRRNSRNKSLNGSAQKADKSEKKSEKKSEANKDKSKETSAVGKDKDISKTNSAIEKHPVNDADSSMSVRDRLQFDDDTSLAVIARKSGKTVVNSEAGGTLPIMISSVMSLSTIAAAKATNTATNAKSIEITVEANSNSCIFTPTSTNNVKNMNDAVSKLQKLRSDTEPFVGRVGVRAFARMTSPDKEQSKKDNVEVEIKAEPIDLDDADRQMEKLDLMNSFRLRPVNPPTNLRDVRINKVMVTPLQVRKPGKTVEVRPRAKKSFPQPKKDDGRSELNGKNSMVYIPIQPPATQSPLRVRAGGPSTNRFTSPIITTVANSLLRSVTSPIMQVSSITSSPTTSQAATSGSGPIVGQVPTSVHTVPMMTSVNGQWMFSFQPVMSVGAIDSAPSPPILNGLQERPAASLLPLIAPSAITVNPPTVQTSVVQAITPPSLQTSVAHTVGKTPDTNQPGEPPRLQQRPPALLVNPLDITAPAGALPVPPAAGPLTAKLEQSAAKLSEFFRTLIEESLEWIDDPAAQVASLTLKLEHETWKTEQTIQEMKHNHELTLAEMRASYEKEKARVLSEAQRSAQVSLEAAVKHAKSKQWCANCNQEAQFYCCWNTSYCDYPCQRAHWSQHFSVCTQQRSQDGSSAIGDPPSSPEHRLQPQPDNLPRSAASPAPALAPAGKPPTPAGKPPAPAGKPPAPTGKPSAPAGKPPASAGKPPAPTEQPAQKSASIIVSMVQEPSGGQSIKCVGTYKPPVTTPTPIILNKQLLNSEEASKKMVSSGGYLIVGTGSDSGAVVTPARRTHAIQYFS